jgi:acyl-CoA synthetase (NDP forming)
VEECGRKQVYGVVVLSSGFAESGPEGAALEAEVLRVARSWGIRVVGPNCLGVLNTDPEVRLHGTFVAIPALPGRVGLLSESGMVGAAVAAQAREAGIGLSSFVALGNRADVSGNDLLQYWAADDRTDVVALYIESFGNARHFSRLARRLTRVKPVVAVKAGWLPGTPRPADRSSDDALLHQTGVIRVPSLPDLLDTIRFLVDQPLPRGRRVAVVGNAGGSLAIGADAAVDAGLELASLTDETRRGLATLVDRPIGDGNPVDLGLRAGGPEFSLAAQLLAADPSVDVVLVVYAPSLGGSSGEVRDALDEARARADHLAMVACFYGGAPGPGAGVERPVPVYGAVDAAARALGRVAAYAAWLGEEEGTPLVLADDRAATARATVQHALAGDVEELDVPQVAAVLECAGVELLATAVVRTVEDAVAAADAQGYPVALKAACRDEMAKTVAGGLALDVPDGDGVRAVWERMVERFGDEILPVLVQPMVEPGVDVAVSVDDHPEVGPVISLRPGGANAALDQDAELQVLPIGDRDAERLVARSRLAPYLDEGATHRLEELLLRIGALVEEVPEVAALWANPVIVRSDAASVIEAGMRVADVEREPLPLIRRVGVD